ncbi:MAG: SEC-C metal-binding domain-containing protein [Bacteroidales bacterium]
MTEMEEFPLEEMFQTNTKKELITAAGLLGIRISQNKRKAEIAKTMAAAILAFPGELLQQLPFSEVLKLQQMVHAKDHAVPANRSFVMDCIDQIGLTDNRGVGHKAVDFIYPDLARALLPEIDTFVEKARANKSKYRREQLILGLLNLYGFLSFRELVELSAIYDPDLKIRELHNAIEDSYLLKSRRITIDYEFYYSSPYATNPDYIWKEINSRKSITRARFTEEKVMDAGIWDAPQPPVSKATGPFSDELSKMQKTEEEINWMIGQYWMLLNNDLNPFDLLQKLLDESPQTRESVNTLMISFTNWGNSIPKWVVKGNSSNHTFEIYERPEMEKRPPQLIMGPNAQKAGISISQEELNKAWEEGFQPPMGKVGRNAPCPCGSGKKYKQCCLSPN